jgi:hypothetical protein
MLPQSITAPLGRLSWLLSALAVGLSGNFLLQQAEGPGVNFAILFGVLAIGSLWTVRQERGRTGRPSEGSEGSESSEATGWIIGAVALTTVAFLFRDAPALHILTFLTASAAFAFATLRGGRNWLRGAGMLAPIESVAGTILATARGPLPRLSGPLLRGIVLVIPVLLIFGALLTEADPIFAARVSAVTRILIPEMLVDHLILTTVLTWLAAGYLTGLARGTAFVERLPAWMRRPAVGVVEVNLVLGPVAVLVLGFVAVQTQTLLGGDAFVQQTPGLTYATYAREGFAQLVIATALILPLLLAGSGIVHGASGTEGARGPQGNDRTQGTDGSAGAEGTEIGRAKIGSVRLFRGLAVLLIILLLLMAASAMARVTIYQDAFGLTEMRLYAAVFLGWLMLVALGSGVTLLRGRLRALPGPLLISGVAVIAGLVVANPHSLVARDQLSRGDRMDAAYVASLSADAVPTVVAAYPSLSPPMQDALRDAWLTRWGPEGPRNRPWHSSNWAEERGRRALLPLLASWDRGTEETWDDAPQDPSGERERPFERGQAPAPESRQAPASDPDLGG